MWPFWFLTIHKPKKKAAILFGIGMAFSLDCFILKNVYKMT